VEKESIKVIWKYYELLHGKSNIEERDKIGLLYVLSYIKIFKEEAFNIALNSKTYNTIDFIGAIKTARFEVGSESRDPKNMEIIFRELERISYSVKELSGILELFADIDKEIAKEIFKLSMDKYFRGGFRDIEVTPYNINKLAIELLDISKDDLVMDIGSGYGDFLTAVIDEKCNENVCGIEINEFAYNMSKLRLSSQTYKFKLQNRDIFDSNFDNKYDKIFCNYPWGFKMDRMRLDRVLWQLKNMRFNWGKVPGGSMDWLFINCMLTMLKENGTAITIMPDGPLFKTADNEFKKDLVKNGLIKAIIKLPSGIFPYTGISSNIVIFDQNKNTKIKFIDASHLITNDGRRPILDLDKVLDLIEKEKDEFIGYADIKKIESNDYVLTVDYYLSNSEIEYHNPKKLSDYIVDIFRGLQINPSEIEQLSNPNGEYEILRISDIEDGIISNELTKVSIENNKYDRYLINNNDVIITSKGTRIKIAVANIGNRKIIANGNLIVLRVDPSKLNPYYLAMYLSSKEGNTILNRIQTGRMILSINPRKLADITISTIELEKQNEVAKKYQCLQEQLIFAKKHLKDLMREQDEYFDKEVVRMFDYE